MGIKACDTTCYPACAPHDGLVGCHYLIGSTGTFTRDERRAIEAQAAEATRILLIRMSEHDAKLRKVLVKVGLVVEEPA